WRRPVRAGRRGISGYAEHDTGADMLTKDELARRVLDAVKGDPDAVKDVSGALVSRDPEQIRQSIARVAGIQLSDDELQMILSELGSNPEQAVVAYST